MHGLPLQAKGQLAGLAKNVGDDLVIQVGILIVFISCILNRGSL